MIGFPRRTEFIETSDQALHPRREEGIQVGGPSHADPVADPGCPRPGSHLDGRLQERAERLPGPVLTAAYVHAGSLALDTHVHCSEFFTALCGTNAEDR